MRGRGEELLSLAKEALREAGEPEAEVVLRSTRRGFARFAIGELGQHMEIEDPLALVRVARGARVAQATTNILDAQALVRAIRGAKEAAERAPETAQFPGFASRDEATFASPPRFAESTSAMDADARADQVAAVLETVSAAGLLSAGVLETRTTALAVATTRGREVSHDSTTALFKVWALETGGAGGSSGHGSALHRDVTALPIAAETDRAIRICRLGKEPVSLDAGTYDVVLEPAAVSELVEWLASIAFTATSVEQGTSALRGRIGERVTGEAITIVESPLEDGALGLAAPFDREGVWRRTVPLLEKGVARGVLYDRSAAARMGGSSTGSALLIEGEGEGSIGASALFMDPGEAANVEELVAGVKRGLYVCRLHYVNGLLEPRRAVMTGLTRDGCFLIEDGKLSRPVGNLRFTDSFLEALGRCDGMTRERKAVATAWSDAGAHVVPAIRVRALRWNGASTQR
jgi:predicted Zn-dependent protease